MSRNREGSAVSAHKNNVTRPLLPPFNVVSAGYGLQTFNPPITRIVLHLFENLFHLAHTIMILNAIAQDKW